MNLTSSNQLIDSHVIEHIKCINDLVKENSKNITPEVIDTIAQLASNIK